MIKLDIYIKAQLTNWIKRLLTNKETIPTHYISSFIDLKLTDLLKCNIDKNDIPDTLPLFYQNVLNAWFLLKQEPSSASDVQREVIWHNKFILIGQKSIMYSTL